MVILLLLCAGKGTQVWKKNGAIYDGDWREGMRNGFGMYSVKTGDTYVKQYAGGWKNDKRHVSCTCELCMLVAISTSGYIKLAYCSSAKGLQ